MAKVTIVLEDFDEGVHVKIESEPAFPSPDAPEEEKKALTEAQNMAIFLTHTLHEMNQSSHADDEEGDCCGNEGCGCHE